MSGKQHLASNPFYVLGLRSDCERAEVERAGATLLGMLELGLSAALRYHSPLGEHTRTPELVREAMAELRDPERRLLHELWATLELPASSEPGVETSTAPADTSDPDTSDPDTNTAASSQAQQGEPTPSPDLASTPFPALATLGLERGRR
ncbi:hypothetical protein G6O69_21695 [Pseudenhygromyxa sp. WMMC2535]|uniref:hypothetical protein n=1 Tax=Pseudenhygromyxa sp. WMMC2535 TaxID=2712867 RepID=UPI00155622A1|nr:hypothetical protein [Pseudenhygromyxa sp. WMMC2535]NVB40469.1 hypothetical protein [Pseudenhygromyxa sp. WMMC2535]